MISEKPHANRDPSPELIEIKKRLDALEGIALPFQLHKPIRILLEALEKAFPEQGPRIAKDPIVEIRYRCARCGTPHLVGVVLICCDFDDMEGNIAAAESWEPGTGEKIRRSALRRELAGEPPYDPFPEQDPGDNYTGPDEAQEWYDFDPEA